MADPMTGGTNLFMTMAARYTFDGQCRENLVRVWDPRLPLAAWLATNPSVAGADLRDPTDRRFEHFSRAVGAGGYIGVNACSWCDTDPAAMQRAVRDGRYTGEMFSANVKAIREASAKAEVHFVAFGPQLGRRFHDMIDVALEAFDPGIRGSMLCLRTSHDGWPLHPLARGRSAILNTAVPQTWFHPSDAKDLAA
jgi:hypothetical protein